MSAWYCGMRTFQYLAYPAFKNEDLSHIRYRAGIHDYKEMIDMLRVANIRSLESRYPADFESMIPVTESLDLGLNWDIRPHDVMHVCSCYDYQACEVEDYYRTTAHVYTFFGEDVLR